MNNNSVNYKNSFFFFIDLLKEFEANSFKVNSFFQQVDLLLPVKYFSVFPINKINFDFIEKSDKMFFFFYIFNKFFFKNQIKNLKFCFINEDGLLKTDNLKNKFIYNLFFFARYFYNFVFILKKIALLKKNHTKIIN